MTTKKLISLPELVKDPEGAFKNDQLKSLLNQPPPQQWVKEHPFAKGCKYLPIDKVELMLDTIFQRWRVEVKEVAQCFNGIRVTVRLHYYNPIINEWEFHDGVGAKELQTEKGTGVVKPDFANVRQGAIDIALPIAKTEAIKDAADHIGKLFGRDINRAAAIDFKPKYMEVQDNLPNLLKGIAK